MWMIQKMKTGRVRRGLPAPAYVGARKTFMCKAISSESILGPRTTELGLRSKGNGYVVLKRQPSRLSGIQASQHPGILPDIVYSAMQGVRANDGSLWSAPVR